MCNHLCRFGQDYLLCVSGDCGYMLARHCFDSDEAIIAAHNALCRNAATMRRIREILPRLRDLDFTLELALHMDGSDSVYAKTQDDTSGIETVYEPTLDAAIDALASRLATGGKDDAA